MTIEPQAGARRLSPTLIAPGKAAPVAQEPADRAHQCFGEAELRERIAQQIESTIPDPDAIEDMTGSTMARVKGEWLRGAARIARGQS